MRILFIILVVVLVLFSCKSKDHSRNGMDSPKKSFLIKNLKDSLVDEGFMTYKDFSFNTFTGIEDENPNTIKYPFLACSKKEDGFKFIVYCSNTDSNIIEIKKNKKGVFYSVESWNDVGVIMHNIKFYKSEKVYTLYLVQYKVNDIFSFSLFRVLYPKKDNEQTEKVYELKEQIANRSVFRKTTDLNEYINFDPDNLLDYCRLIRSYSYSYKDSKIELKNLNIESRTKRHSCSDEDEFMDASSPYIYPK